MKQKRYLIEYEINFDTGKEIGKDEIFTGEGLFYLEAINKSHAKRMALKKIRKLFKRKFQKEITRIEVSE